MKNDSNFLLSELPGVLEKKHSAFLCCASFEERSFSVASSIKNLPLEKVVVYATEDCHPRIIDVASDIRKHFDDQASIVITRMRDPLFTANAMAKSVRHIKNHGVQDILIDITTFTHEMLLILLKLLSDYRDHFSRVTCVYTSAQDYSLGDPKERKWLSKGCREVRSVFGFPGQLLPGRPTCLIVLVGFEHERAMQMIVEMDPQHLLLGRGIPSDEHLTHESHGAPMVYFHKLLKDMVSSRGSVESFEFSCNEPYQTTQFLLNQIQRTNSYNHIVVPLNTKISTVAIAQAALKNAKLQVCYAEPETYNFAAYSKPDNKVTIFEFWNHNQNCKEVSNCKEVK